MNTPAEDAYEHAIAELDDVRKTNTDAHLASMRADLLRGGIDGSAATSIDVVRLLELLGIANGVRKLFPNPPELEQAKSAAHMAFAVLWTSMRWSPASGASRTSQLSGRIDWTHATPVLFDGTPAAGNSESSFACPITAYLQACVYFTPLDQWVKAAMATDPLTSPLAFAWSWARETPAIGRRTADVAAIVAMGRAVSDKVTKRDKENRLKREKESQGSGIWASITSWVAPPPPPAKDNKDEEMDPALKVAHSMLALRRQGRWYAELLLRDGDAEEELDTSVQSLLSCFWHLLSLAEEVIDIPQDLKQHLASLARVGGGPTAGGQHDETANPMHAASHQIASH